MTFGSIVQTFVPNEHLNWKGRLLNIPWLFSGAHHFVLSPTETGTRFEHWEQFSGILALILQWTGSSMFKTTQGGFDLMNKALKERVEGGSVPNTTLK